MQGSGRIIIGAQVFSALVNLFLPLLLARNMSASEFSQYIAVVAFAGVASLVGGLGLDRSIFRFVPMLMKSPSKKPLFGFFGRVLMIRGFATAIAIALLSLFLTWFSTEEGARLSTLLSWLILTTYVLSLNEIFTSSLQAVLRFTATARIMLGFSVLRLIALLALLIFFTDISVHQALAINVVFDCGILSLSAITLFRGRSKQTSAAAEIAIPPLSDIMHFGLANYLSYVIASAWAGPTIRLLVAASAPAGIASAYGLFQSLADRGRLFLPVGMMDRQLEPAWSADYHIRKRALRFKSSAGAVLKIQFYVLATLAILFSWSGDTLISSIVRSEFGKMYWIVPLILLQLYSTSILSILWATLNSLGRADLLWRGMLAALLVVLLPLLYVAREWGPGPAILMSCVPAMIVITYLLLTRNNTPVSIALQMPAGAQLLWVFSMVALGNAGTQWGLLSWFELLSVPVYLGGAVLLSRMTGRPLVTRAERYLISRYFARSARTKREPG